MAHVIETAPTGRAKCRGCGLAIAASVLRFGERGANPFGEGEATQWFHVDCAAFKRPEPLLETLAAQPEPLPDDARRRADAEAGIAHPRLQRVSGAERASSGRAQCRSCRSAIAKDTWRLVLVFFEEGRFTPGGFVHASCARAYFETETADVMPRVRRFAPGLGEDDLRALEAELQREPPTPANGAL